MFKQKTGFTILCFCLCIATKGYAQFVYGEAYLYNNFEKYLVKIDLATCTICPIKPFITDLSPLVSFTVLADGTQLFYTSSGIIREDIPPSNTVLWSSNGAPGTTNLDDGILAPTGEVYLTDETLGLMLFDPATNEITPIGLWPAGGGCTRLYYLDGVLHGVWQAFPGSSYFDMIVNVTDPANSTFGPPIFPNSAIPREVEINGVNGLAYIPTPGPNVSFYNPNTGTSTTACSFPPPIFIFKISTDPPAAPDFPCVDPCTSTDAGTYSNTGPYTGCGTIDFPDVPNYSINATETINYILYTDPADPLGSALLNNTVSSFTFNPATMQTGVTYYGAAIAGNNLSGIVNLNDPCLDLSDSIFIQFITPTVSFMAVPAEMCPGGCQTITATFTGDPPFALTGQVVSGASIVGSFSEVFSGNTGTFEVCAPANVPPGTIQVQAISLTDAHCTCN